MQIKQNSEARDSDVSEALLVMTHRKQCVCVCVCALEITAVSPFREAASSQFYA